MKRIIKKTYYRIEFSLASSLSIGSGENKYTDRDIIRDSLGEPYIPATAIAGVCRSMFPHEGERLQKELRPYFGDVEQNTGPDGAETKQIVSRLIFYDAKLLDHSVGYHTSVRDSVALNEYKTVKEGAKFEMEVLEPDVCFRTYLEQSFFEDSETDYAAQIIGKLYTGKALLGGKSTRGYGNIKVEKAECCSYDLQNTEDVKKWIDFDLYGDSDAWTKRSKEDFSAEGISSLCLSLKQKGGISIRKYTTQVSTKEETKSDYSQLTLQLQGKKKEIPVIPGTSWAGAIRHRMCELGLSNEDEKKLFGYVEEGKNGGKQKSAIRFGESQINGAQSKILSRNAIDRFSGGTVDGALFTEETYYGGTTKLVISCDDADRMSPQAADLLAAALADLHYGFLAVGGETSIGRGLFEITAVNGQTMEEEKETIYSVLRNEIRALWG